MKTSNVSRAPISVLIAATVRLYRDGLAATLKAEEHLRIEGTAATSLETLDAVRKLQPHVVIIDVSLKDVLSLIRTLRAECSKRHILALAVGEELTTVLDYAEAGADGFVNANASAAELVEAIQRTAAGELLCSPRMAAQLLQQAVRQASRSAQPDIGHNLTRRELQVFALLKQGRSNKEIALALNIAEATVKNHVHHLLEKLQVATRGQAVAAGAQPLKAAFEQHISARCAH